MGSGSEEDVATKSTDEALEEASRTPHGRLQLSRPAGGRLGGLQATGIAFVLRGRKNDAKNAKCEPLTSSPISSTLRC